MLDRVREVGHDVAKLCAVYNGTTFPPEQVKQGLKLIDCGKDMPFHFDRHAGRLLLCSFLSSSAA